MGGPAELFPWWLWLLCGMWAGTFVLRSLLLPSSDWRWVLDSLLAVYASLLVFMCVGNQKGPTLAAVSSQSLLYLGLGLTFAGVLAATSGRCEVWTTIGQAVALIGCSLLGILWSSPEFSVVCVALGLLDLWTLFMRRLETDPPETKRETASCHPVDASPTPLPRHDYWLAGGLVAFGCVLWLGLIPFIVQVELQQAGANRWSTALPSRELVARWHQRREESATSPAIPRGWSWGTLLLGGAVVWLAWQQRTITSDFDEQKLSSQFSLQNEEPISSDGPLLTLTSKPPEPEGEPDA